MSKPHWENIHAGEKPYSCQKYDKMYTHTPMHTHTHAHTHAPLYLLMYIIIFIYYTIVGVREVCDH